MVRRRHGFDADQSISRGWNVFRETSETALTSDLDERFVTFHAGGQNRVKRKTERKYRALVWEEPGRSVSRLDDRSMSSWESRPTVSPSRADLSCCTARLAIDRLHTPARERAMIVVSSPVRRR